MRPDLGLRTGGHHLIASPLQRLASLLLSGVAGILAIQAVLVVGGEPGAALHLPGYLITIYLFHYSWSRMLNGTGGREYFFIGLGLAISIARYILFFTSPQPYLDFLHVATFYCFAYSQALVLQESRPLRWAVTGVFLSSLAFMIALVWTYDHPGRGLLFWTQRQILDQIGPAWLLSSIGLFILFLLDFHVRAVFEIDDFAIRLRLGFLIATWLLFLAVFLCREGDHFGWFTLDPRFGESTLILSMICILLGLAMPHWLERFFAGLNFLDRRTSREVTLFVLGQIVKNNTGSPLTELSLAAAERLDLNREDRRLVFLACELLEADYTGGPGDEAVSGTAWKELAVTSAPEAYRLAAEQRIVFKAWRLKRGIEQGAPDSSVAAQIVAAARACLLGQLETVNCESGLIAAVRDAAAAVREPSRRP